MQNPVAGSPSFRRLTTPAVDRVTAWHREQSMRQARAAFDAIHEDEADAAPHDETPRVSALPVNVAQPVQASPR
jgi:hypothetical protein